MEMRLAPSGLEVGGIIVIYRPRKVGLILSEIGRNEVILDPQFAEWTISARPDRRNGRPCYGQELVRGALHSSVREIILIWFRSSSPLYTRHDTA